METIKIRKSKVAFENYGRHLVNEDVDVCIGEDYVVLTPCDGL